MIYPITRVSLLSIRLAIKIWPIVRRTWPRIGVSVLPHVINSVWNLSMAIRSLTQTYGVVATINGILALRRFLLSGHTRLSKIISLNKHVNSEILNTLISAISLSSDHLGKIGFTFAKIISILSFWHIPIILLPVFRLIYIPLKFVWWIGLIYLGVNVTDFFDKIYFEPLKGGIIWIKTILSKLFGFNLEWIIDWLKGHIKWRRFGIKEHVETVKTASKASQQLYSDNDVKSYMKQNNITTYDGWKDYLYYGGIFICAFTTFTIVGGINFPDTLFSLPVLGNITQSYFNFLSSHGSQFFALFSNFTSGGDILPTPGDDGAVNGSDDNEHGSEHGSDDTVTSNQVPTYTEEPENGEETLDQGPPVPQFIINGDWP